MLDYILGFASRHGLGAQIRFNTAVMSARPLGANGLDGWEVTTSDGESRRYDGVIVANGHLWDPFVPHYPGVFAGRVLHSGRYRNTGDLEGQRVLVMGAGNSGCDLAVDAAQAGYRTTVSVRNGLVFQPKTLFGRPRSELALLARLPVRAQERVTRALIDVALGRPERYGLPAPATRNLHRNRPVVNGQLLHFIHHGRVNVAPGIERFDGHDVYFTDGTRGTFDTIVYATGFRATLPFLESTSLQWADGVPMRVAGMTLPVGLERLFFVGLAAPPRPAASRLLRPGATHRQVPRCPGARRRLRAVGALRALIATRVPDRHPAPRVAARHGPRVPAHLPRPAPSAGRRGFPSREPPRLPGHPRMSVAVVTSEGRAGYVTGETQTATGGSAFR
jgi:cation diffusion facilitator CzcD-associated flavoprotein CzcO